VSPPASRKLFLAWAGKRRQVVELEDRLAALDGAAPAESAQLADTLKDVRADADQVLAQALEAFHAELRERGLE
jgi:hypothetical protein